MIVYAFYGIGKTEFSRRSDIKCVDADEMDFIMRDDFPKCYNDFIESNNDENTIVFVNARPYVIDYNKISVAFMPSEIEYVSGINKMQKKHGIALR